MFVNQALTNTAKNGCEQTDSRQGSSNHMTITQKLDRQEKTAASKPEAKGISLAETTLKHERNRSRKAALLIDATRQFCTISRPERHDIDVYKELFYQFVDGLSKAEKRQVAVSLSRNAYIPRTAMMYLALQDHDIAAPILLFSEALNEADIAILASKLSVEHLKVLSRRFDLSPASVGILRKAGGRECVDILARNPALLPRAAEKSASEEVMKKTYRPDRSVKKAEPDKKIVNPVVETRPPARPAESGERNNARQRLIETAGRGGRLGRKQPDRGSERVSTPPPQGNPGALEGQLVRAARDGGTDELSRAIEILCGLPTAKITRMITASPESFAVLLKGLGAGFVASLQLFLLTDREIAKNRARYDATKALIAKMEFEPCRRFLVELGARFAAETASNTQAEPARPPTWHWHDALASRRRAIERDAQASRALPLGEAAAGQAPLAISQS